MLTLLLIVIIVILILSIFNLNEDKKSLKEELDAEKEKKPRSHLYELSRYRPKGEGLLLVVTPALRNYWFLDDFKSALNQLNLHDTTIQTSGNYEFQIYLIYFLHNENTSNIKYQILYGKIILGLQRVVLNKTQKDIAHPSSYDIGYQLDSHFKV